MLQQNKTKTNELKTCFPNAKKILFLVLECIKFHSKILD